MYSNVTHFNYTYLRSAFRTSLLNELETKLDPSFKKVKSNCYREHKHGFYVYAKPNRCDPKVVIKYIGRYLGCPVIATSRIDKYDGENVTFQNIHHEDGVYVEETIPVMEFIERLIRHIPEKHFKMIRYGGIYARRRDIDKNLTLAISSDKRRIYRSFNKWREGLLLAFGYDPLTCECGATMIFQSLYYRHEHVSLEEDMGNITILT